MSKFTPGPWRITKYGVRNDTQVGNHMVGYVALWPNKPTYYTGQDQRYADELEERAATCRLIAASPDLYEALKMVQNAFRENMVMSEFVKQYGFDCYDEQFKQRIEAAIAKAEGEQS